MYRNRVRELYFTWLVDKVCEGYQRSEYEEMLKVLFNTEFTWSVHRDENRAFDGLDLRRDFVNSFDSYYIYAQEKDLGPQYCTVLEMLVALALRIEEEIMYDPIKGDRTGYWFWKMIENLRLDTMIEDNFDMNYVHERLDIFMCRKYRRDGSDGALFYVTNSKEDYRKAEIWYQMNWYIDSLIA